MTGFRALIQHPRLTELYDYWERIRGDRAMPLRADFDPMAIPRLLPNIVLNEVERNPVRFRIRLEGTAVSEARGWAARGRYIDEPGVIILGDQVTADYARMLEDFQPIVSRGEFQRGDGRAGLLSRLALPLSHDGAQVAIILVGFYHELQA